MATPSSVTQPSQAPNQASLSTNDPDHNAATSNRGGHFNRRGRGRGRGGRGTQSSGPLRQEQQKRPRPAPPRPPPDDLGGGGGVSGHNMSVDAATVDEKKAIESSVENGQEQNDALEAEVCFICASPVIHNAVAPCNHRTCHICTLRLRALYKTRACAHCRTESQYVIFTDDAQKRFEDFRDLNIRHTDETLGVKYTENDIHADTLLLLRYNCPDETCDVACLGWPHLHHHVKAAHHKVMCDLCARNKKVFTHEHELFTPQELRKHEKVGDDTPGSADQSGFKGHPECGFCRKRFYGDDELFTHCREQHERCHICDRRRVGGQQQYFLNYDSLEEHFRKDHFLCLDKHCLEQKFVVFESEIDMKAHQLQTHPNGLTKDARRDARRVDISTFDFRAPHQESRRGRGHGRDRGRGRDPNVEPLPQSTAQPLRRDELAYQRQLAMGQSRLQANALSNGQQISSQTPGASTSLLLDSNADTFTASSQPPADLTPQQKARHIAHSALVNRASAFLDNNPTKLSTFRSSVSAYQHSSLTANDLITRFFSLFDVPSSDLGKLVHELAELYENSQKRDGLLKAWNDWRAINEDYPSLPSNAPGSLGTSSAGGHRLLKLKSSTQQSAQRAPSSTSIRGWGTANPSQITRGPAISSTGSIAKVGTTTPWASSTSSAPISRSGPVKPAAAAAPAVDAFPALPPGKRPNTLIAGLTRGSVRPAWETAPGTSKHGGAWRANAAESSSTKGVINEDPELPEADIDAGALTKDGAGPGKKKGKQGKKEVLYKFG